MSSLSPLGSRATWDSPYFPDRFRPETIYHRQLRAAADGDAGEFSETDDRDSADDLYRVVRGATLVVHRYLGVSRPCRDGHGYVIDVALTDLGVSALAALDADRVWSTGDEAPSDAWTIEHWNGYLREAITVMSHRFDRIHRTTLPILRPVRERCDERRAQIARTLLGQARNEEDPIFGEINTLPDRPPFDAVRREAFHQRMILWSPK